jgi:hypothetical protein
MSDVLVTEPLPEMNWENVTNMFAPAEIYPLRSNILQYPFRISEFSSTYIPCPLPQGLVNYFKSNRGYKVWCAKIA